MRREIYSSQEKEAEYRNGTQKSQYSEKEGATKLIEKTSRDIRRIIGERIKDIEDAFNEYEKEHGGTERENCEDYNVLLVELVYLIDLANAVDKIREPGSRLGKLREFALPYRPKGARREDVSFYEGQRAQSRIPEYTADQNLGRSAIESLPATSRHLNGLHPSLTHSANGNKNSLGTAGVDLVEREEPCAPADHRVRSDYRVLTQEERYCLGKFHPTCRSYSLI